jgi:hypothetical protein
LPNQGRAFLLQQLTNQFEQLQTACLLLLLLLLLLDRPLDHYHHQQQQLLLPGDLPADQSPG